jgi:hypothetical protein
VGHVCVDPCYARPGNEPKVALPPPPHLLVHMAAGALQALKKKKMFEAEIEKHGGIMMNLERQINMLESATIESQILATFKTTAATMKKIQGGLTAEDVDDAMDDIREQMDLGTEIGAALSAPLGDAVGEVGGWLAVPPPPHTHTPVTLSPSLTRFFSPAPAPGPASLLHSPFPAHGSQEDAEDEFARLQEELAGESMLAAPAVPATAVAAPPSALPAFPVAPMAAPVAASAGRAKTREELELEELTASMA